MTTSMKEQGRPHTDLAIELPIDLTAGTRVAFISGHVLTYGNVHRVYFDGSIVRVDISRAGGSMPTWSIPVAQVATVF